MAEAFLLKTDVTMISSNASQKYIKNQATEPDEGKVESFSSALDKQVDEHAIQQHKKLNDADNTSVKSGSNEDSKTEISSDKSGKKLPEDSVESTEQQYDTDDKQLATAEEEQTEILSDDVLNIALNAGAKSDDAMAVEHHTALKLVGQTGAIKKNVIDTNNKVQAAENSKLAADMSLVSNVDTEAAGQEEGDPEPKQQAQSLRSDILNALLKKPTSDGDKIASAVEQKIASNTTLTPVSKQGLSEEQQIMALATNLKLKGSSSTGSLSERSASVSSLLLTPAPVSSNAVVPATVSSQPTLNLQPALQSEAWGRVLSSRVIWMAREGVQQASLKLNPANMGPVEVKLHMHNDQANISFIAQHAATRDALEQALPRLRESFQENGMELAHADVSQENFSQTDEQDNKTTNNGTKSDGDNVDTNTEPTNHDVNLVEQDIALGLSVFA